MYIYVYIYTYVSIYVGIYIGLTPHVPGCASSWRADWKALPWSHTNIYICISC